MTVVNMPDGSRINFPDSMAPEEIQTALSNIASPAPEGGVSDSMSWGDAFSQAKDNFGSSAAQAGSDMVQPILHPIDTAKTVAELGLGIIQKLIPGEQDSEKMADAVGQFFIDRYTSIEGIKNTLANDPAGMLLIYTTLTWSLQRLMRTLSVRIYLPSNVQSNWNAASGYMSRSIRKPRRVPDGHQTIATICRHSQKTLLRKPANLSAIFNAT
jgi:hypothetical protein